MLIRAGLLQTVARRIFNVYNGPLGIALYAIGKGFPVSIAEVISLINQMEADGVLGRYAIGGAERRFLQGDS